MNGRQLVVAIGAILLYALVIGIIGGTVLPALGLPAAYEITVVSAGAAVILAFLLILFLDSFDRDEYLAGGLSQPIFDVILVTVGGLLAAALIVYTIIEMDLDSTVITLGEFVVDLSRIVAAGVGVGAGLGVFYVRNRQYYGQED